MIETGTVKPVLVFAYGNPARGDDGLGPALLDLLSAEQREREVFDHLEVLTDFQLQIEHALDLRQRERVLFVDASIDAHPPFRFHSLAPRQDIAYTTHAMDPAAVLAVYRQIYGQAPCPVFMLSIRGYAFDLGGPLSAPAQENLVQAYRFVADLLLRDTATWIDRASRAA